MATLMVLAFLAGLLDSIVGGGGLIQLPALLVTRPHEHAATLLGTNKLAAFAGVTVATGTYLRRVVVDRRLLLSSCLLAALSSIGGALAARTVSTTALRWIALILTIVVAAITVSRPQLGLQPAAGAPRRARWLVCCALVGAYDGFYGPGTGTFLLLAATLWLRLTFLEASAYAKAVNAATNLTACIAFGLNGNLLWAVALPMAAANLSGAAIGARWAIARGSGFIRLVFLAVVAALALRLAYDLW